MHSGIRCYQNSDRSYCVAAYCYFCRDALTLSLPVSSHSADTQSQMNVRKNEGQLSELMSCLDITNYRRVSSSHPADGKPGKVRKGYPNGEEEPHCNKPEWGFKKKKNKVQTTVKIFLDN